MVRSQADFSFPGTQIALSEPIASSPDCTERLWDKLGSNPSVFGRLLSIAEMWNSDSGRYESPLCSVFGPDSVDRALREMHQEVFNTWLSFRLQQQERDVTVWLSSLNLRIADGIQTLQAISRRLITLLPPQHVEPERQLFFQDFQLVSTMVRWADVEAGIWIWPENDEDKQADNPTLAHRVRNWFKCSLLRRD